MNTLFFYRKRYPDQDECEFYPVRIATKLHIFKDSEPLPIPNDFSKFIKLGTFYDYDYFSTMMRLIGTENSYSYSTTGVLIERKKGHNVLEYRENPALGLSGSIINIGYEGDVGDAKRNSLTILRLPTGLALHFKLGHFLTLKTFNSGAIQFVTATKVCENTVTPYNGKITLESEVTVHRRRTIRFRYEVEVFPDTSEIPTLDPASAKLYYILHDKVTSK